LFEALVRLLVLLKAQASAEIVVGSAQSVHRPRSMGVAAFRQNTYVV